MRYVKNPLLWAALAVAVLLVSAYAVGPGGQHKGMGMMGAQLGLSDAQKAQIKTIVSEYQPKIKAVRDDSSLTPVQKKDQIMPLRKEMHSEIMAVLNPEQQAKAKEMMAKRGAMHRGFKSLNLSDEQKTAIKSIHESTFAEVKAVKADSSLTDAQKRDKIVSIRKDSREQVMKVLTPAQREDLKACAKSHKK